MATKLKLTVYELKLASLQVSANSALTALSTLQRQKRILTLVDRSMETVDVEVWDDEAALFDNDQHPVLVKSGSTNEFDGTKSVSTNNALIINPHIREAEDGSANSHTNIIESAETSDERNSRLENQRLTSEQQTIRLTNQNIRSLASRATETAEEQDSSSTAARATETPDQRESRLRSQRVRPSVARARETSEQRESRLRTERSRSTSRENETIDQNIYRRKQDSYRHRRKVPASFERIAFNYTADMDYSRNELIAIGSMNNVCRHCNAYKYKHETQGMCCSNGKIVLPQLLPPPQPLLSLMTGSHLDSQHFLRNIRKYNSAFQMTSFGASNVMKFVEGQIYHRMGSLLPSSNEDPNCLQIYFIGQADEQVQQRQRYNPETNQRVVADLQEMFHGRNELIRTFKQARDDPRLCSDEHLITIHSDNAPTIDDMAILIVGEPTAPRDIIIRRRDGKLFHQYIVDMYAKIEMERLMNIRRNQPKLRVDNYIHLQDAINSSIDINPNELGRAIILPATFTSNIVRHMQEYRQDAMAYMRSYGRPDLFIMFTCNPKWEEITSELSYGQTSAHRHDITARVFKLKLKSLLDFIVKMHIFGETRCWMYSVEWQNRGLPHAHILIWLVEKITPNLIDSVISAEIPDPNNDPQLHDIVIKNMVHGPCGSINPNSPCMVDGKCTKKYPRQLLKETISSIDGYPLYRRRSVEDGGKSTTVKDRNIDVDIDNRWIVPYCPLLSKTFKAHINVEYCSSVKSIKYVCKYLNKGPDMAVFSFQNPTDEVTNYQIAQYISSNEAVWRILGFPIHERHPIVVHLAVHLENRQLVYFNETNAQERALLPPSTTLTSFFDLCRNDLFAKTLLYAEVPKYFTWNASSKKFQRRKQGKAVEGWEKLYSTDAMGSIYTFYPQNAECFYLRKLLTNVRGPTSFENLRTVDGKICATYREACQKLQLLESDDHWETTLAEASVKRHPRQIRALFAIILVTCSPSNPKLLWKQFKEDMAEDILHQHRALNNDPAMEFSDTIFNEFGMFAPIRPISDPFERDLLRETDYHPKELEIYLGENLPKLQPEQKNVYDYVMDAIINQTGGLHFIDAPVGTGKTFLISLILASVRSQGNIALAIASSGIAATLLDGGRTAHSALKLPLTWQFSEDCTCNITKNSSMGKVLQTCKIIVWNECNKAHKKSLEALNRTLQDLRNNTNLFGGALILLAGDFRQTLPVIPSSTPADELNACIKSSSLWSHVKTLKLTTNMRVALQNDKSALQFSKQLLDLGNGKMPVNSETNSITFPGDFCKMTQSIEDLIISIFPNIECNFKNTQWLCERALLAAKNVDVNYMNNIILNRIVGSLKTYNSIDTVMEEKDVDNYPIEFLNSLDPPGFPPHVLTAPNRRGIAAKSPLHTWSNVKGEGKLFSIDLMDESFEIRATALRDQCDKY
ncbi:uncharacterized protein LOC133329850 [Musca vetustissima]|uniref:uncharacterized protein LOC133329850 n=1 Tax=Musca vetustissima TaxID=27455 RepID=UPI002AB7CA5C|nr:uncharacterized protein LOC133329850 [Musca vetustissima]